MLSFAMHPFLQEGMMQKHTVHFLTREPPQRAEFWPPRINITWRWIVNHRHSCPLRTWLSFWTCFLVSAASHKLTFPRVLMQMITGTASFKFNGTSKAIIQLQHHHVPKICGSRGGFQAGHFLNFLG